MQRREVLKRVTLLLGGSLSSACQQALQQLRADDRDAVPVAYNPQQREIAHRLADLIIPPTDTPGALQAGVGEFIDYVVSRWYHKGERARFLAGLDQLQRQARVQFGSNFVELPASQQAQLLSDAAASQANESASAQAFGEGSFFTQIKELTVVGYYTSEIGSTQELNYLPMPGSYDGHYKFAQVGRQWSS